MNNFVHCCSFSTSNKITSKGCQSASQTCDFDAKNAKFFWGGGTPPPQTPPPMGRGTPPPHTLPPWRLNLNPSHSEILPTLLSRQWKKDGYYQCSLLKKRAQMNPPVTTFAALLDEVVQNALPNFINESAEILPL